MADSQDNFNLLAAKLKLQTEQRIRYQQDLSTLSAKFQEFKDLQENIQLILAHNHQAEVDSWNQKYTALQETYKLDKERSRDLNPTPQSALEEEIIQLKETVADFQHKLKTEKIRSQQNLELFVSSQAKLSTLQDQVAGQQLHDVNLAHLISLQQQIDTMAIEKLKAPQQSNSDSKNDNIVQDYPTPVLLLEEIKLLKNQHKRDQAELVQLRLSVQQMTDEQAKLNGSSATTRSAETIAQLQQDLKHTNDMVSVAQQQEDKYKAEIEQLQAIVKDQNGNYQKLLTEYNSTQQRLKQSHHDFASSLTQEMAQMSLESSNAIAEEENSHVAELELHTKQQQAQIEQFQAEVGQLRADITALTAQNDELIEEISVSKETIEVINMKHSELEQTLVELNQHKQSLANTANAQIKTVLEAVTAARQERDQYRQEVVDKDALMTKLQVRYQAELSEQRHQQIGQFIAQLQDVQDQLTEFRDELMEIRDYIAGLSGQGSSGADSAETNNILGVVKGYIKGQNEQLDFLKKKYDQEVKLRKSIFNQLQELKGNIRVFARLRPISNAEKAVQGDAQPIVCLTESELRITQEKDGKKNTYPFEFERVFDPSTTQAQVFEEVKDLIMSCIDGYKICIFSYGQTGSGKTFSMEGAGGELKGINPRALEMLFNYTKTSSDEVEWTIKLTMVEIYNEKIQDLLRLNDNGDINLKIISGKDGTNEIAGVNLVTVTSAEEVAQYLAKGKKNRHMSATMMNAESSRSHLVVTIYLYGYNKLTKVSTSGRLNLIDLAGSERVSRSGVTGDGLTEAKNINASLSNLGSVIAARASKQAHVPYRNSQLTYLLQDSLDKNSKTLMIVQLSPTVESVGETLCSLRFAARVKEVELGKATASKSAS